MAKVIYHRVKVVKFRQIWSHCLSAGLRYFTVLNLPRCSNLKRSLKTSFMLPSVHTILLFPLYSLTPILFVVTFFPLTNDSRQNVLPRFHFSLSLYFFAYMPHRLTVGQSLTMSLQASILRSRLQFRKVPKVHDDPLHDSRTNITLERVHGDQEPLISGESASPPETDASKGSEPESVVEPHGKSLSASVADETWMDLGLNGFVALIKCLSTVLDIDLKSLCAKLIGSLTDPTAAAARSVC